MTGERLSREHPHVPVTDGDSPLPGIFASTTAFLPDAELIAHAPADLAALLEENRQLREQLQRVAWRYHDAQCPVCREAVEGEETRHLRDLLAELLRHDEHRAGLWTRGMRDRVRSALGLTETTT